MNESYRTVDLTHRLESGMPIYPGDRPEPQITTQVGSQYTTSEIQIGSHYGTHLDAPRHFLPGGKTIDEFDIGRFTGPALCLPREYSGAMALDLTIDELEAIRQLQPHWLIVRTGFDRFWGRPEYFQAHPYLSAEFARQLVELKISGIGIDFPSVDAADAADRNYPIHHLLMEHEILILENLTNLTDLPLGKLFTLTALPLKIDADGAPARVVASF